MSSINQVLASVLVPSAIDSSMEFSFNDWLVDISPSVVFYVLNKLAINKASKDIPALLFKKAAALLADPLYRLFWQSIDENYVPLQWKVSSISPITKNKSRTLNNVRPISLLPLLAKILERIVVDSVKSRLLENVVNCQFRYRPKSSMQSSIVLISLHEYVIRFLDDKERSG